MSGTQIRKNARVPEATGPGLVLEEGLGQVLLLRHLLLGVQQELLQPRQSVPQPPDLLHLHVVASLDAGDDVLLHGGQEAGVKLLQGPRTRVRHVLQ